MLTMGVDAGSTATKVVVMDVDKDQILGVSLRHTGADVEETANEVIEATLKAAGVSIKDLDYVLSTGWGRRSVSCANSTKSEIMCHAAGAFHTIPQTRSVIDIGGQDSKAISLDDQGTVVDFVMNDKCAAGTGRFLETLAGILEINLEEIGTLAIRSDNPILISSTCVVFAETEVVAHRAKKEKLEDIVAGVVQSLIKRVITMAHQIKVRPEVVFTGGPAKNPGLVKYLEKELGQKLYVPEDPQIVGAIGAALLAKEEALKALRN